MIADLSAKYWYSDPMTTFERRAISVMVTPSAPFSTISDAADPQDTPMLQAFNAKLQGRTALLKNPHDPATGQKV